MNHLFVCCHYDDEVYGPAGTMHKLAEAGDEVNVLYVAKRALKHKPDEHLRRMALYESSCKVAKVLKFKSSRHAELEDQMLYGQFFVPLITAIEDAIEKTGYPCWVWTHWDRDFNQDHRSVADAAEIATRRLDGVAALVHFEVASSTELAPRPFEPNYFVELSKASMAAKMKAVNIYETELGKTRNAEHVKTYAKFRGLPILVEFAEAFKIIRMKA